MKKFSTWLIVMFMVMFWLFRVVIAFTDSLNIDSVVGSGTKVTMIKHYGC